jgi:hypothetical protein
MNLVRFLNIPEHHINKRVGLANDLEIADDVEIWASASGLTIRWQGEDAEGKPQIFRFDLDIRNTERLERELARYRSGT